MASYTIQDPARLLHRVRNLVERGERLTDDDCRSLFDVHDLNEFSKLARIVRERRYGREAFFRAAGVAAYRGGDPASFIADAIAQRDEMAAEIVVKCSWRDGDSLDLWLERARLFVAASPDVILQIDASFIAAVSEREGGKHGEVIERLQGVVPVALSGAGAELFDERFRSERYPSAISSERWLAVHQAAHGVGLSTGAAMTFYPDVDPDLYVAHLSALRSLQDTTSGFASFTPMAWHDADPEARYLAAPSPHAALRLTAIARLFLDNVGHIVAPPAMTDPELAYVALSYGADTVDTTVRPEDLLAAGAGSNRAPGGELMVLSNVDRAQEKKLALATVVDRIEEARWKPVPVTSGFERLEMIES